VLATLASLRIRNLALVEDFLKDAVNLYQTMSGNTWR
jgi:hypothetical protein